MALIKSKAETGEVTLLEDAPAPAEGGEVVDIMALLKRSLEREKGAGKGAADAGESAPADAAAGA